MTSIMLYLPTVERCLQTLKSYVPEANRFFFLIISFNGSAVAFFKNALPRDLHNYSFPVRPFRKDNNIGFPSL